MSGLLDLICVGKLFETFDEVEQLVSRLREELYFPIKFAERRTAASHNKKKGAIPVDEVKVKYQSANIVCSHFGDHRDRSTGARPNQHVFSSRCPFKFRVSWDALLEKYRIQSACLEHEGHVISAEAYEACYRVKKSMDPIAIAFAEKALLAGAVPDRIRKQLSIDFGTHVNAKFLQNIKQKVKGLPQDEWANTVKLLNTYEQVPGNVIKVLYDAADNTVNLIFIQLAHQRELYKQYGEVVLLDATYKIAKVGMPLFTLLIVDNFGVGQPIGFFLVREETTDSIMDGLRIFASKNDVTKTTVVLTDKDCKELTAIHEVFPHAKSLLCTFNVLQAVDRRLEKAHLLHDFQNEVYEIFRDALYSKGIDELEECAFELCNIEQNGLGNYFAECWFDKPELWAIQYRDNLLTMGNNTTNRLERFHSTLKKELQHCIARLPELFQVLIDIILLRLLDRDHKRIIAENKTATRKPPAVIAELAAHFTPYAFNLVEEQLTLPKTSYSTIKSGNTTKVVATTGMYTVCDSLASCCCTFFRNYGLPCRHILFIATVDGKSLPLASYNQRWLLKLGDITEPLEFPIVDAYSPMVIQRARRQRRNVTRQDLYCEANMLVRSLANTLQDLPLPAYHCYMTLLHQLHNSIKANKSLRLVEGNALDEITNNPLQHNASTPIENLSLSDSILAQFMEPIDHELFPQIDINRELDAATASPRRPNSLLLNASSSSSLSVRITTPVSGPSSVVMQLKSPTIGTTTLVMQMNSPVDGSSTIAMQLTSPIAGPSTVVSRPEGKHQLCRLNRSPPFQGHPPK